MEFSYFAVYPFTFCIFLKMDQAAQIRKLCFRLSAFKQPADGVRNSPGCVSETSKKEERTDLGQRVSDKSVKWTPTKTAHIAPLYLHRKALIMQQEP